MDFRVTSELVISSSAPRRLRAGVPAPPAGAAFGCALPGRARRFWFALAACLTAAASAQPQSARPVYFAHPAVEDDYGVIAPWYHGLNGQCDFRARVAAETMKRYPWTNAPGTGLPAPDYIYNGRWTIDADGTIHPGKLKAWSNGDLVQRGAYAMLGWVDYYRYTSDPAAIAHVSMIADVVLRSCLTANDHPWPGFPISVPNHGETYGPANPDGMIQLDLASFFGLALMRGYEMTGNAEWFAAAQHWADLLAEKRSRKPGAPPWNRYANPEQVSWNDLQTGGVVMVLDFLEEVIRCGYSGRHGELMAAREAGRAWLKDALLPRWLENDTWARDYWDWEHPVQGESISEVASRYLMRHPDVFPNWRADSRNIASLYLHRSCVSPKSLGDVYSGAWAYPEGSQCCGLSLSYAPMQVGAAFAEYGVRAGSEWGRELARRQFLLATYDCRTTGVVEDGLQGGGVVAGDWFQIAHPLPLRYVLEGIAWLPEALGANRENHIVRCSSTVKRVRYGAGRIAWETFDAPKPTVTVLRLAFEPSRLSANGRRLQPCSTPDKPGYQVKTLVNGDCLVEIRHDGLKSLEVSGDDPQRCLDDAQLSYMGLWRKSDHPQAFAGALHSTSQPGAAVTFSFTGNQVRLLASVSPGGGLAEVYLDGQKQLCGIDFWNPLSLDQQLVYSASGLSPGQHTIRIVASGHGNPLSKGAEVTADALQFSAAAGEAERGVGGGPGEAQRWIFGYPARQDYIDSRGNAWRPATEFVLRSSHLADPVATNWFVLPRRQFVAGTADPDLYRYGVQAKDFTAYFTVRPGIYHARVRLMESRLIPPQQRVLNIQINGQPAATRVDIAATAAAAKSALAPGETISRDGLNQAVDLAFNDIQPSHGTIAVRFSGADDADAMVSAVEIGPGTSSPGARPISVPEKSEDQAKQN